MIAAAGFPEPSAAWQFEPVPVVLVALAAALYGWGMLRVYRRHPGRPWPIVRAASFAAGLAVIAVALLSPIGRYGTTFFWVHMIQHLMLIMVGPAFLVHGRPLILTLHAVRNPWHTRVKRALRSLPVSVVTHPAVAVPIYAAVVVGTHLTSFNNRVLTTPAVAHVEVLLYLFAGYNYLLSGFGDEPIRWHLSRPAKTLVLFLTMPIDTFTGLALMTTGTVPWSAYTAQHRTWGPDPLTDIHWGGAMMWVGGDIIMLALVATALVPWVTGRARSGAQLRWIEYARRANLDRHAPAAAAATSADRRHVDDDENRLDAYNAYLARLSARDRERP